ncbi:hypothetical protein, partial [Pseudomonas viridiflava]|uniref:hypothetical protein n=1 Tax=Pseudomonas viridiflava TaxID=33069 RepID=UPI0019D1B2BE
AAPRTLETTHADVSDRENDRSQKKRNGCQTDIETVQTRPLNSLPVQSLYNCCHLSAGKQIVKAFCA